MRRLLIVAGVVITFCVAAAPSAGAAVLLGDQKVESSADSNGNGVTQAFSYTAVASGTPTDVQVYVGSNSASGLQVGIYSDSAGTPSRLLASGTLSTPTANAWNDVKLGGSPPGITSGTKYWISLGGTGSSGLLNFRDVPSGGTASYAANGLPSTWSSTGGPWPVGPASAYVNGTTTGASPPSNTGVATISGTTQQGQTLSTTTGTWTNSPTAFAYQWEDCDSTGANCASIAGATTNSYTLTSNDVGHTIRVVVIASNSAGQGAATSNPTATITTGASPPSNTGLPTISGTTQQGQTLSTTTGTWNGTTPITYTYQWQRCTTTCSNISGATSSTYTLTASDVSDTIDVIVTATNSAGNASATSAKTATVTAPPPPGKVTHVVWVLMENHGYGSIIGSSQAPYINQLANTYGLATNYFALSHPSLPNYIGLTSGGTQGISDDNDPSSHPLSVPSIFSQLPGGMSRSLQESMPSNCLKTDSGQYLARHNPMAYYTNLGTDCSNYDVPFGSSPDLSAAFTFVTPNAIDDMHDGTIAQGDLFLSKYVPALMATPQYQAGNTAIFIVWDEDEDTGGNNQVPLIVVSPSTNAVKISTSYNHYSLLRTTEDLLGLPALGGAASASPMESAFGLTGSAPPPPANTGLPVISGTAQQGQTLSITSNGTWNNNPTGFAYQWQDCDSSGANCTAISGATAASYTLTTTDVGHTIRAVVTASNSGGSTSATSAATAVVTAATHDPVVVAVGDIACAPGDTSNSCQQAATETLAAAQQPDAVLPLGDNQYNSGLLSEYTGAGAYNATWGILNPLAYPTPGNHEYTASATAAGYFSYFGAALHGSTASAPYYSYNLGRWHLISLDSSCSDSGCSDVVNGQTSSAQTSWLQSDLAAHPAACTLAYWHHPRFSGSWSNDSPGTGPLFAALYNAHADIVVSGHDHVYERYAQQDPTGAATTNGVRQFVAGTGGESLFTMLTQPANLQVSDQNDFGVLVLTLHASSYDWAFKRLNGSIVDSGTTACHGSATGTLAARAARAARLWPTGPTGPALRFDARLQPSTAAAAARRGLPVAIHLSRAADVTITISLHRGHRLTRIASFYETETQLPRPHSRILLRLPASRLRGTAPVNLVVRFAAVDGAGHHRALTRAVALKLGRR
ncbi:MAG: alkaline phosphatase family protein [Solirubrobacteraceae bacterium]